MKTYLSYGLAMAIASLLLTLALFFAGYHSDPEKIQTAQLIVTIVGLAIGVIGIALGTKARRAEVPASEPFGYGRALGAGVMIGLFSAIFGTVFHLTYSLAINPDFNEMLVQAQMAKLEADGMAANQIEAAEAVMRKVMHPALQAVFGLVGGTVYGTIIALITSIFLRRGATDPVATA